MTTWDGDAYQARFDALAAQGADVHGEAAFVRSYAPTSVLDAGCGTGRVGVELARHGIDVVGVDLDESMLATARAAAPALTWIRSELGALDLGRTFDLVVLAGNVVLFTPEGTEASMVAGCARHVRPGGHLVAGFQLGRGVTLEYWDAWCAASGLTLVERFSTWARGPLGEAPGYAVSVHGPAGPTLG